MLNRIDLLECTIRDLGGIVPDGACSKPVSDDIQPRQTPSRQYEARNVGYEWDIFHSPPNLMESPSYELWDEDPSMDLFRPQSYGSGWEHELYGGLDLEDDTYGRVTNATIIDFIACIPEDDQEILVHSYWRVYSDMVPIVDHDKFCRYKRSQPRLNECYSPLLHLCLLAIGFRHLDGELHPATADLLRGTSESKAHRLAKDYIRSEKIKGKTPAFSQALLILSDLEFGVGKLESGWKYASKFLTTSPAVPRRHASGNLIWNQTQCDRLQSPLTSP
jgi:hypothetical protein